MPGHPAPSDSTLAIQRGLRLAHWTTTQLWVAAVGIGGGFLHADIEGIASGEQAASRAEHDILAAAMNEHFIDRGENHPVEYWRELRTTT